MGAQSREKQSVQRCPSSCRSGHRAANALADKSGKEGGGLWIATCWFLSLTAAACEASSVHGDVTTLHSIPRPDRRSSALLITFTVCTSSYSGGSGHSVNAGWRSSASTLDGAPMAT